MAMLPYKQDTVALKENDIALIHEGAALSKMMLTCSSYLLDTGFVADFFFFKAESEAKGPVSACTFFRCVSLTP